MMDAEQAAALRAEFPPETIGKLPKGGTMLDYVGHAATTDRLLKVDPEWTWEPFATDPVTGLPALDPSRNLWIRLTVCGVTRIGVGDGKSMKECIGDAIRNAAMRFGVALDLWAKEDLHPVEDQGSGDNTAAKTARRKPRSVPDEPVEDKPPTVKLVPNPTGRMFAALGKLGLTEREPALDYVRKVIGRPIVSRNDLTPDELQHVIAEAEAELAAKDGAA